MSSDLPRRISSFYQKQVSLGATFSMDHYGWVRADRFLEPAQEKTKLESGIGLADISHVSKLSLKGPKIMQVVAKWCTDPINLGIGRSFFALNMIGSDGIICGLIAQDEALFLMNPNVEKSMSKNVLEGQSNFLSLTDVSSVLSGLYLLGPETREVMSKLTELNVNDEALPNQAITQAPIRHVQSIIHRMDLGKLLGFQIFFERAFGEYMWEVIFDAGEESGIVPVGKTAIESCGWSWG